MDPVTCILLAAVLISLYYYLTWDFGYWEKQGVKCDKPWPIIGTLTPYWKKPVTEQDNDNYKKFGSVYGFYEGSRPCLGVAEPELLRKIFVKDFSVFPDHRKMGSSSKSDLFNKFLTVLEGEEWKTVRQAMSPAFSTKRIKPFVQNMNESSHLLVKEIEKELEKNEEVCLRKIFARFALDVLASYSMGIKINSLENPESTLYKNLSKIFTQLSDTFFFIMVIFPQLTKMFGSIISQRDLQHLNNIVKDIINNRLESKQSRFDPLEVLLKRKDEIEPDALSIQALLFLTGGDGSGMLSSLVCYEMAINPTCQEKLISEIDEIVSRNEGNTTYEDVRKMEYLDMVIAETLRKYPPLFRLERVCKEEGYDLDGIKLKYGTLITIPAYSIHHDEKYFPEPYKFIPERFSRENITKLTPFTYMPFGLGPRSCVASRLGLMSLKLTTIHFFSNFRVKPTPTTPIPLNFRTLAFGSIIIDSMILDIEKRTDKPSWD